MPSIQYECQGCGQLTRFSGVERDEVTMECPVCEKRTVWAVAFEGDGVSF